MDYYTNKKVQDQPRGVLPCHAGGGHPRAGGPDGLDRREPSTTHWLTWPQRLEVKNATLMWPVRIAAAGKLVTPGGAVEICRILGREETLRRLRRGLSMLTAC